MASPVENALERYADMVRRICFLHLRRREDVEDAFQEVFLRYLQREEPFGNDEHEKAWLIRVALQRCRDLGRGFRNRTMLPLDENIAAAAPAESRDLLEEVLRLPPNERDAIYLFYYEGYDAAHIARLTGSRPNTVYSRLHRARKRLRRRLGGSEDEEDDTEGI
ncbi:MAG: sigma-70 family RNA polymerase sigma factor [Clostridia bacterium]|nr:sigma-70 family RNA polymerase sigma factor [Clostridia bacterium]